MTAKNLLLGVALAIAPALAGAQVLYQQVTIDTQDRGAFQDFCQQLADDFVPVATGTVTNATWQGSYYQTDTPGPTISFTLEIYADNGGLPANSPLYQLVGNATQTASGTHLGKTLYDYALAVASPALNSGTTYWFSVYPTSGCSNYAWTDSSDGTQNGIVLRNSGGAWQNVGSGSGRTNHVFTLTGGTPPPVTVTVAPIPFLHPALLALLAVALAGLGIAKRRRLR